MRSSIFKFVIISFFSLALLVFGIGILVSPVTGEESETVEVGETFRVDTEEVIIWVALEKLNSIPDIEDFEKLQITDKLDRLIDLSPRFENPLKSSTNFGEINRVYFLCQNPLAESPFKRGENYLIKSVPKNSKVVLRIGDPRPLIQRIFSSSVLTVELVNGL